MSTAFKKFSPKTLHLPSFCAFATASTAFSRIIEKLDNEEKKDRFLKIVFDLINLLIKKAGTPQAAGSRLPAYSDINLISNLTFKQKKILLSYLLSIEDTLSNETLLILNDLFSILITRLTEKEIKDIFEAHTSSSKKASLYCTLLPLLLNQKEDVLFPLAKTLLPFLLEAFIHLLQSSESSPLSLNDQELLARLNQILLLIFSKLSGEAIQEFAKGENLKNLIKAFFTSPHVFEKTNGSEHSFLEVIFDKLDCDKMTFLQDPLDFTFHHLILKTETQHRLFSFYKQKFDLQNALVLAEPPVAYDQHSNIQEASKQLSPKAFLAALTSDGQNVFIQPIPLNQLNVHDKNFIFSQLTQLDDTQENIDALRSLLPALFEDLQENTVPILFSEPQAHCTPLLNKVFTAGKNHMLYTIIEALPDHLLYKVITLSHHCFDFFKFKADIYDTSTGKILHAQKPDIYPESDTPLLFNIIKALLLPLATRKLDETLEIKALNKIAVFILTKLSPEEVKHSLKILGNCMAYGEHNGPLTLENAINRAVGVNTDDYAETKDEDIIIHITKLRNDEDIPFILCLREKLNKKTDSPRRFITKIETAITIAIKKIHEKQAITEEERDKSEKDLSLDECSFTDSEPESESESEGGSKSKPATTPTFFQGRAKRPLPSQSPTPNGR